MYWKNFITTENKETTKCFKSKLVSSSVSSEDEDGSRFLLKSCDPCFILIDNGNFLIHISDISHITLLLKNYMVQKNH